MSVRARLLIVSAVAALVLPACGAGGGNVYVGVGVVGPYWGYPGRYPYPGYVGRPPVYYWDDDDAEDAVELVGPLEAGAAGSGGTERKSGRAVEGNKEDL